MYEYNEKTGGICSLAEFSHHGCINCPKKGMCDFVVEMRENELSNTKKDELSNNTTTETEQI
jgi:hypothetical protein